MTKVPEPSWDTRSKNKTEDEIVEGLSRLPMRRLLHAAKGYAPIIEEVASDLADGENKKDLIWIATRIRLVFLVVEQRCSNECKEDDDE